MGTLTDITARAGNTMKRQSNSSMGYQSLDSPKSIKKSAEKENSAKSRSPHFMTPTFSSSLQSATTTNITPVTSTKSSKVESNNAWMKSAAKRVGFRRTGGAGDGTPRSKKEGPPKSSKTISFPDKLATPSYSRVSDTPPSIKMQPIKTSPTDKPLPNPPKDQCFNPGEFDEPKTLIDASDKPLRRRSPPGMAVHEEDWPVLFPKRPTSPGTLQEMLRDTGSQLTQQALPGQKERYPILGNTLRQVPDEDQLPVSRYSATYNIPRKSSSSSDPEKHSSATNKDTVAEKIHQDDPFKDGIYDSGPLLPAKSPRATLDSPSNLSAGAAAVEKLAQESRPTVEPRQTRTSSLRARLSAGQLVRDGQNKVVGFTDFTANPDPASGITKRDGLRARKEARVQRSLSPSTTPVSHPLRTNPSKESIGANRAPAQFVAGSRRPTHPRRPSSRGSLRNEFREPTPPLSIASSSRSAPSRPAPAVPSSENTKNGKPPEKAAIEVAAGKSYIPVLRQPMSDLPRQPTGKARSTNSKEAEISEVKKEAHDEFKILERNSSLESAKKLDQTVSSSSMNAAMDINHSHTAGQPAEVLMNNYGAHILEAIEESPQHAYKLKHLSTASPEFGPTLKISRSAERIIMGSDIDTKSPLDKKRSKELDRAIVKPDQQDRPSSSQGLYRSESRLGLMGTKAREKKVKSADLGKLSPAIEHLLKGSHKLTPQSNYESTDASATRGSSISTSVNDPFFDARSQLQASPEKGNDVDGQEQNATGEESCITPLEATADALSTKLQITTGTLSNDSHLGNGIQTEHKLPEEGSSPFEDSVVSAKDFAKEPKDGLSTIESHMENSTRAYGLFIDEASPFADTVNESKDTAKVPEDKNEDASVIFLPSTPEQRPVKHASDSGSHPPRSSSRTAHPNFTTAKNSPVSPLSVDNRPATPLKDTPQDFIGRQNNLGSLRGHGTSQLDLSIPASKRDSTARESNKSQASASKGGLSIFRGLFHKRSSENEPLKSVRKTKSKSTITSSSGSPFPPISEVHPIHRPTLASLARSAANTPRPTTTTGTRPTTPATPSLASPETSASTSTNLAMELLDLSRKERSSPKKEKLLQLGSIMVEGITQARNAEKAMEEAKQAARRAEVAHALCRKSLRDVTRFVEVWRDGALI